MSIPFAAILSCAFGLGFAATPPATSLPAAKPATTPQPPSAAADKADSAFETRLAAIDAAIAKITDFKANFEQRKYTPLLKKLMISKGVLTSKGGLVKWETTEPRPVTILIDPIPENNSPVSNSPPVPPSKPTPSSPPDRTGQPPVTAAKPAGEMRVYYPSDRLCEIYPIGGALIDFASAPLPRLAELRGRFSIELIALKELGDTADNPALLGLLLRPKSSELRKHLDSIKLLIDETIPAATKVIVTDAEGERTEISLSSIQINSGLKDTEVQLALPDGVRLSRPLGNMAPPIPTGLAPTGLAPTGLAPTGLAPTAPSPTPTNYQPNPKTKVPGPSPR